MHYSPPYGVGGGNAQNLAKHLNKSVLICGVLDQGLQSALRSPITTAYFLETGSMFSEMIAASLSLSPVKRPNVAVAVTGHCQIGDAATVHFVEQALTLLLTQLQGACPGGIVALSGLAAGADTIFAETALALGIPLEACLACADIVENFPPGPERERFFGLLACSRRVHRLPFAERSNVAYMALGHWLVDSSDVLIAVWNGLPAAALGGTGDVVAYAVACGRPVIHVHTVRKQITLLQHVRPLSHLPCR